MVEICAFCGKPAQAKHHLIFGTFGRKLADEDNLYIYLCDDCHNMSPRALDRIHGNSAAERLSKMLGQMQWERDHITEYGEQTREAFMKRYGRSYL